MDIIIKSFNRPYYLDRCIQSIKKYVLNSDYRVVILDDGTSQKYLDKLIDKYSDIIILKSSLYNEKVNAIEGDFENINQKVPIDLWVNAAKNASDYFILLEDDIWFTASIDLNNLEIFLRNEQVQMLKLFWLGNSKLISDDIIKKETFFSTYKPKLYTINPLFYKLIFKYYRFKIRKIATFFKVYNKTRALNYYAIYSVAGVVFDRNYFLSLWKKHNNTIDEGLQLYNAVNFLKKNKNKNISFAKTNEEIVKTGFLSSATNQHKNYENVTIDMFLFNKIVNEAWFNDDFDAMENFPNDLNMEKIEGILNEKNQILAKNEEWQKWVVQFKQQYTSLGCIID